MQALGLEDVTLVGNDTGGALCQIAASQRPAWLGRLVLTSCDAFEHFPPPMLKPLFVQLRLPGGAIAALTPLRMRAARRLPIAYGLLTHDAIPDAPSDSYVLPALRARDVRADLVRVSRGIDSCHTLAGGRAAEGVRPPGADRLVGGRQVLPARGRRAAGGDDPRRALRAGRGRAHVLAGGQTGAAGRADRRRSRARPPSVGGAA